ncbi:MAG: DHH family phosphoesterase [Anaerovibrio sp.]|uniref:DHH family phosphoesterase n=1 Tax=Anaerovibrio TaxID=82373 RepID=UPI002E763E4E|nr:DHH family phosphoesterase [Anaerovibrio sp.]MBQ5586493.1 DHH family phosphoesterase [Selenomonadaceae bacterium]MBQ5650229.1 DHH family phosphoesterase [Selenomonadaceae bacterium]MBQ5822733.1 DHH family phosphoesterase [Selenomonadaceae bacterium]MBQ5845035.1 DHH family phosphoesterase [Selenomonadaceae bacterium]MBQ5919522.1 DHH family phosphoesterase [Selenomonadaceae bacterium]
MPRNLNAWLDICFILFAALILTGILAFYNLFVGTVAGVVWLCLLFFARERCLCRSEEFDHYCHTVISNVNSVANYALEQMPQIILMTDQAGRVQWFNKELEKHIDTEPAYNMAVSDFWPELDLETIWGRTGTLVFVHENIHYHTIHRPVATKESACGLMALYIQDASALEILKRIHADSRTTLMYVQIDNYNDVLQGLNDTEQNSLIFETNKAITDWVNHLEGFLRKVSDDLYIVVMEQRNLDTALEEKFDILDKVRTLQNPVRHLSVTLSIGVAVAESQTINQLGGKAYSMLEMALGRGGDQVAVLQRGKTNFYGGKTKAVEKYTRVKARIISNSIHEIIQESDEVFIMGHQNEDFDALGAALGVSRMARQLKKPVHIILSDFNTGISKFTEGLKAKEGYSELFLPASRLINITAEKPVLFVVDTHIPHLTASPDLLDRIKDIVVIDHHRRSSNFIKNARLTYSEPATSSTSELVTELLYYFNEDMNLPRLEATALYAGILVDTKNFAVQTGVRTFDAAAYLRRCGADPIVVRQMFRSDFETEQAKAKAKARAQMLPNGLIITKCADELPNIQVIAAQVADSLLRIEGANASMVVFQLSPDTVGISARSTGAINVQVIMEQFGGGGHQNVAGAQITGTSLEDVYNNVIKATQLFIEENEKDESNTSAGC